MSKFISIKGMEINNPDICIKGNGHFACVCERCMKEFAELLKCVSAAFDKGSNEPAK